MVCIKSQPPKIKPDDDSQITQARLILDAVKVRNPVIGLLLEFSMLTGLRHSDVSKLKRKDVLINGSVIRSRLTVIQEKKYNHGIAMGKPHTRSRKDASINVFISERCKAVIEEALYYTEGKTFLFESDKYSKAPKSYSIQAVNQLLKKVASVLELDIALSTHSFRKGFAMLMLENGGKLHDVRAALGHSSLYATIHYLDSSDEDREAIAKKMCI